MTPSKFKYSFFFCLHVFLLSGVLLSPGSAFGQTTVTFSTVGTTTWIVPAGVTCIQIECWGGGGGGGANEHSTSTELTRRGGGGGGGAYSKIVNYTVSPGQVYTVVVGAGGTGSSSSDGNPGGVSEFKIGGTIICSAAGGAGGKRGWTGPGAGGAGGASGVGFLFAGGNGASATNTTNWRGGGGGGGAGPTGAGQTPTTFNLGGNGNSPGGNGGNGGNQTSPTTGNNGSIIGAGGGGAGAVTGITTSFKGGNGARGQVTITPCVASCTAPSSVALSGFSTPICSGTAPGTFTATATGGSPTSYSYLWYKDGVSTGITTQTYTPGNLTATTSIYCAVSTGAGCTTNSSTQSIVVNATPSVPTATSPQTLCSPATVANLVATGTALKWYTTASGGTALLSTASLTSGTYYVSQTIGGCESARASVSVTVNPLPVITVQPTAVTICANGSGSYSVTTTATSPTFLWQYFNGSWTSTVGVPGLSGQTTSTLTLNNPDPAWSGLLIQCVVTSGGCQVASTSVPLSINPTPSAPTVTSPQTLCSPATVANLVATGTALKWYATASGGTALLSTASLTSGTYYVSQTVGGCESARTSVSVTVQSSQVVDVAISASPSANICIGTTVTFTATPVNGGSSPVYQWKVNGGNAGTNSNTFTTASLMNGDVVTCEMTSNAGACLIGSPAMSDPFTVVMPTPALLLSANESKTCVVNGSNWVRFYGNTGRLLGAIHPNSQNLGEVTMQTFVASPGVMNACDQPTNPLYSTVYMGRTWVMNSSQYPTGASFPSNVSVRLPFNNTELAALNSAADAVTIANPNDGGTSAPAALPNLMLTKITGATEDGVATAADCASTIIGITTNAGTGTNYTSILNTSYLDFSVGQFSEFFLHKNNANMPLPVELISFRGTCTTDGAHLTWQTASEINNDYFVVQRSRDGVAWEVIGQVQGSGSTTQIKNYDFIDENISGEHYYRLIQVDLNGDRYEKHPIFVDCAEESVTVTVFPNPTTSSFVLNISGAISPSSLSFSIVDITGKWIDSQELQVEAGVNTFLYDRDLAPGTYVVQVQTADEVQLVKLVVRN